MMQFMWASDPRLEEFWLLSLLFQ